MRNDERDSLRVCLGFHGGDRCILPCPIEDRCKKETRKRHHVVVITGGSRRIKNARRRLEKREREIRKVYQGKKIRGSPEKK